MGGWSFAHAAVMGLGAYTTAILTAAEFNMSFWISLLLAASSPGYLQSQSGFQFSEHEASTLFLSSFAAGEALRQCFVQFSSVTGGNNGIAFIPRPSPFLGVPIDSTRAYYYLCLIVLVLVVVALTRFAAVPSRRKPFERSQRTKRFRVQLV